MPSSSRKRKTSPITPSPDAPHRGLSAVRHPWSVALFIGTAGLLLAADLVVKHFAFEHVAGDPLVLTRSEEDGTTVVHVRMADGQLLRQPRSNEGEPSSAIPRHEAVTLVPSVLSLKLTLNTGAVFGLGKNRQAVFAVVSLVAVVVIAYVFYRSRPGQRWLHVCLGLILSGALGNLYDRMLFNAVRDMFWLFPGVELPFGWSWPGGARDVYPWLFNVADAALVVGVGMMLVLMWRQEGAKQQSAPALEEDAKA